MANPTPASADAAAEVTGYVKAVARGAGIPVIVKLAPNVPSIGRIARAVVAAGADALCVINTMPGMVIDAESGQAVLANRSGGLSGPAIKPIALKCVYDVRRACPDTPIIGTGGVSSGLDAVEMLMAGATAVGVGSAIYYRGPDAIAEIRTELAGWLATHGMPMSRRFATARIASASTPWHRPVRQFPQRTRRSYAVNDARTASRVPRWYR